MYFFLSNFAPDFTLQDYCESTSATHILLTIKL